VAEKKNAKLAPKAGLNQSGKTSGGFWKKVYNLLFHEDIYCRVGGYLLFGAVLFLASWAVFLFVVNKVNLFDYGILSGKIFIAKIFTVKIFSKDVCWRAIFRLSEIFYHKVERIFG
jgi:hypothetical protein